MLRLEAARPTERPPFSSAAVDRLRRCAVHCRAQAAVARRWPLHPKELAAMQHSPLWLVGFGVFVLLMLVLDLGFFNRRAHTIKLREALLWSGFVVGTALVFNLGIWLGWFGGYETHERARAAAQEFLAGYLMEYSLSVDNLFVFALIFTYFAVPAAYQHRVLYLGILGALVFRGIFIFAGLALVAKFSWMMYVFGALLIVTGIKLAVSKEKEIQPERNPVFRLARWLLPVSADYVGGRFVTRVNGRLLATPLLLVLVFVETTDVVFAADSIPAVFGITQDPFIVYTSNVFAILGLRALYFALASVMRMFRYLSIGLSILLVFIGCKMLVQEALHYKLDIRISLGVIALILVASILASVLIPARKPPQPDAKA
jgi:tellurite resistance protein TerC